MQFYDYITEFIFVEDEPTQADIIFVPGGPYPDSARHAAMLYRQGFAPYIMPSGKYSILKGQLELPEELWQELAVGNAEAELRDDAANLSCVRSVVADQNTAGAEQRKNVEDLSCTRGERESKNSAEVGNRKYAADIESVRGMKEQVSGLRSRIRTESDYLCEVMRQAGVPDSALLGEDQATYTYENAIYSRKKLEELGFQVKKAILCCQAFHARRSLLYYKEQFPEVEFLVCPVVTRGISRDNWYRTELGIDTVLGEVERCGSQFHEIMRRYME